MAWTPDGQDIVFSVSGGLARELPNRLWRVSISGGTAQPLAGAGERGLYPAISPRTGRLVYERRLDEWNIWRFDLPGATAESGRPEKFIASTQNDFAPQVSPDGKRIAFQSSRSGNLEIWVCDRDGSNPVQLTSFGVPEPGMPKWSRDGKYIAFDCPVKADFDVFVMSSEGGSPRQLTTYSGEDSRPNWSGDGRWIYFDSDRTGEYQIWKVPAEGGEPVQVTQGGGFHPVESPDGRFLYYGQRPADGLWKMPVGGGEEVAVLPSLKDAGWWGSWDVVDDGIYFIDPEEDSSSQQKWFLKFFHFDTQEITRVVEFEKEPAASGSLDISPDGTWFLYAQIDQSGSDLMLVENFR